MKTFKQILKELATTDGGYKGPPKTPGANKKGGGGDDPPLSHEQAVEALRKHFKDMHGKDPDTISSSGEGPTRTTIIGHSSMPGKEMSVNGDEDPILLHSTEVSPNKWKHVKLSASIRGPGMYKVGPDLLHDLENKRRQAKEKAENERLHPGEIDVVHHPDVGPVVLDYDEHNKEYRAIHINDRSGKIKSLKASYHPNHHKAKIEFREYVNSL